MKILKTKILLMLIIGAIILSGCAIEYNYDISNPQNTAPTVTDIITTIISPEATFQVKETYVEKNGTRVYLESSSNSQIKGVLYSGDIVKLVDEDKEYFLVECNDVKGYVHYFDLTTIPTQHTTVDLESYEITYPRITVIKSLHILELWDGDTLVFTCSAQIGQNEDGDKQILGDKKTPEGSYYVCSLNPGSKYYKGMYISYPNQDDALEAYNNGTIDESTRDHIINTSRGLNQPPFDTPLGGFISIHGKPNDEGYTAGCIAIPNEYMDLLWELCPVRTQVKILP